MISSLSIQSTAKFANGDTMPLLGFGVWDSPSHLTTQSCLEAITVGYRHIDTAQVYGNEKEVGKSIEESGLPREEIFVTSKILSPGDDNEGTYRKVLASVEKIAGGNGYLDLMLIHNKTSGAKGIQLMWQAMEKLMKEGKLKAIGVSNFGIGHIKRMKEYAEVWPPMVNQLELHPWLQQKEIVEYCHKNSIIVQAYCPLVRNQKAQDHTLKSIAERHGKSTAQVLIRYCLEKNWVPLPKSDNPGRIAQNADVYDFALSKEDMKMLDGQDQEPPLVMSVDNKDS